MLFNSFEFAIFLPLVFLLYWFVFNRQTTVRNIFLLVIGYVFYGWWDWRFLFLIAFSTTLDFLVGIQLGKTEDQKRRKLIFSLSCLVNLGFLGFFKYFNFFADSLILAFEKLGYHINAMPVHIILPVGISFYTFQSLSYTADVYFKRAAPTKDFIRFAAFISFFPQLVAGPIERAVNLLPQFESIRKFSYEEAISGMREILLGLFKKIVIADTLSGYADPIFANYKILPGSTLLLGAVYFAVQIYCDFSGYSSIAVGTARLFGFKLMQNFSFPYFSKSVSEFWRNWHISLTTWFRDYVYIPLGGSKISLQRTILNTLIVFSLSGLWHGANWTFVVWGLLNGLFIVSGILLRGKKQTVVMHKGFFSSIYGFVQMGLVFLLITLTWVFFRSPDMSSAVNYLRILFSKSLFSYPVSHGMALALPLIFLLFLIEAIQKSDIEFLLPVHMPVFFRWSMYLITVVTCLAFFKQNQAFIYFQF